MGTVVAFPRRPKKRGRKPTKPPACPVFDLANYRPAISAEVLYHRANQIDEDPSCYEQAERLYREAIRIRPDYAMAMTNLGNVRFRLGDITGAEQWYRRAIELDPSQPEAEYNLGYMALEQGFAHESVKHFERAIALDPTFASAYFNLAMALEQMGRHDEAQPHWRRYLKLESSGTWAEIARRHLIDDTQPPQLRLVR